SLSFSYIRGKETNKPGTTSITRTKNIQNHNYIMVRAGTGKYWNLNKKFALGTQLEAVMSNTDLFSNYRSTMLTAPGYYPTPHSKSLFIENFHSNNFLAGGLISVFNINPSMHFRLEAHGFLPIKEELRNPDFTAYKNSLIISNYYLMGMAALVYHTGSGPISIALNYYEKPNTDFYLTLNFGYILFNKRGL
ncbi:MAG: hypothetical protein PHH93_06620, partial [Prolixibacteraceae bacterium]|nr:hypothetical protein [Prolixibacteraceae bacterium]